MISDYQAHRDLNRAERKLPHGAGFLIAIAFGLTFWVAVFMIGEVM